MTKKEDFTSGFFQGTIKEKNTEPYLLFCWIFFRDET